MKTDECLPALRALADPTRQKLVELLLARPRHVNALAEALGTPQYNVSKHLRILRAAGLVVAARQGKEVVCSVAPALRARLQQGGWALELGCCAFRFTGRRRR
jgi:ArsR family transcriptional regulator